MKRLAIVAGALALIFIVAQQMAQAQQCTAQDCIYLPAAQQGIGQTPLAVEPGTATQEAQNADETATSLAQIAPPIIGTVPVGTNGCELAAPAPIEGAQAWVTNPAPFNLPYVCVRLVVQGRFLYNFTAQLIVHGNVQDFELVAGDNSQGQGVARAYLGGIAITSDSTPGSVVPIDVAVTYLNRVYLAHTSFTAPPESTATPTITPTL